MTMNTLLYIAAFLTVAIGIAHSYLGEHYILIRLFRRDNLPKLFDSGRGLFLGQLILSIFALWVGYKKKFRYLIIYLISAYLGMNTYSYIFGGSEQRVWALLGMVTTISLIELPAVFGLIGKLLIFARQKTNLQS